MIYNVNGAQLNTAYDVDGEELEQAYDIGGNPLMEQPVSQGLVVMTYNVQWFSGLNADQQMQQTIIDTYKADIIGLQELHSAMPEVGTAVLSDYPYITLGAMSNKTGMASKIQLNNISAANFVNQASETRGYQKAYFTYNGKTICWVNTHLETSTFETVKVAQAAEVFALVQNETYFIITGDFNTTCKSTADTEYTTIMKQFLDAGYNSANCSEQHGFIDTWTSGSTAGGVWYPTDHVITSANIDIETVVADTLKIDIAAQTGQSIDHIPLIALLTVN